MKLHEHKDFRSFVDIVGQNTNINVDIILKDYWVTCLLHSLADSSFNENFIFKGGTSLSKGWQVIDRFSEDVDLLLIPDKFSKKKCKKLMKDIENFLSQCSGLELDVHNKNNHSGPYARTSCYQYPKTDQPKLIGLLPFLKLEMGFRGGTEPNQARPVQSIIGKYIIDKGQGAIANNLEPVPIKILHPARTFVEKIYALHNAFESGTVLQKTRHYYDVYRLLELPEVLDFFDSKGYRALKKDVAKFSLENWSEAPVPSNDDFSKSNAFDFDRTEFNQISTEFVRSDIYFGPKPNFDEVAKRIRKYIGKF